MRVSKMSGKGVLFVRQSPARQNCKKKDLINFSPGDFFKKGVFFLFSLISLDSLEIILDLGGTLSIFLDLGGSPRQEKPAKSPRKGGGGSEMLAVLR